MVLMAGACELFLKLLAHSASPKNFTRCDGNLLTTLMLLTLNFALKLQVEGRKET